MAVLLVIKRVCSFQESKEATTEEGGINYDVFLEELRLISMCNSNSENLCDPNGKISPFHDQGIPTKGRLFYHLCVECFSQQLLILYTLLNQMRVVKNIRNKDDRITSL